MENIDDLLLGSEEEEQEAQAAPPKQDNSTIKEMRKALREATKAREALEAQVQEFRSKESARTLETAGLSAAQQKVFLKAYDEVTPEAIAEFRRDVLGVVEEQAAEASEEQEEAPARPFRPTDVSASAGTNAKVEYTTADWNALRNVDPVKADKLLREGRVKHREFNPGGPAF